MSIVRVRVKPEIFNASYLSLLRDTTRTQILFGGSSSGKSVFLSQRSVWDLLNGGRNYLVARNTGATLRTSTFNEIKKVIGDWNVGSLFTVNKSDMTITCRNGF